MKNIKISLWAFILGSSALWFLADSLWPQPFTYFSFRYVFNQYSGVLAIGAMSLCMVLAVRPVWLENWLNGLDKGYRLHKWLGITALVTSLAHFWFTKGTKWMVGWGWLTRPERRGRPGSSAAGIEQWLGGMRSTAESVGEWAFYIAAALMIMALIKRIPYHWFAKLHKWLAAAYLALVFHAVVLIKFAYWKQPVGWLVAVLLIGGTVSALMVLFKRSGAGRRSRGKVEAVTAYPLMNGFGIEIAAPGWQGHRAGQFAFIRHENGKESAHPFTVASAWDTQTRVMRFFIKNLGNYTARAAEYFKAGETVLLEGPYGRFTFNDDAPAQIWVAGGIGITPFMARLDELAHSGGGNQAVELFYCYREDDPSLLEALRQSARQAKVTLHLWPSGEKGRLNGETLRSLVPNWQQSSVWFCGGTDFGRSLQRDLRSHGLPEKRFHQEWFEMR